MHVLGFRFKSFQWHPPRPPKGAGWYEPQHRASAGAKLTCSSRGVLRRQKQSAVHVRTPKCILIYYTLTVCCTPRKRCAPTPGMRRIISSVEGADRAFYSCHHEFGCQAVGEGVWDDGFNVSLMGFNGILIGFNRILMGFHRILVGFNGISRGFQWI